VSGADPARERGAAFVDAHGDALARASAAALARSGPLADAVAQVASLQKADGGFAAHSGDTDPELAGMRRALGALDDLRALRGPVVERACAWLDAHQADDGHWSEGPEEARIFTTGTLAGHLCKSPCARQAILDAAADYLAARWSAERVQRSGWRAIAAYTHLFASLDHDLSDEVLQRCGRELEHGYREGDIDAVRAARVLTWCGAPSLPGARIDAPELVDAVRAEQAPDGGWLEPGAPDDARVAHTLDALAALHHLDRRPGPHRDPAGDAG
jgi:hypothetical protein